MISLLEPVNNFNRGKMDNKSTLFSYTAIAYEIRMQSGSSSNIVSKEVAENLIVLDFVASTKIPNLIQLNGQTVTYTFQSSLTLNTLYYFTIVAVDDGGNYS